MFHALNDSYKVGHGDYKVLTESKDKSSGKWFCTIQTPLQKLDDINNNKRVYSTELMAPVIKSIQPLVRERHLVGEYGHPVFEAGSMSDPQQYIRRITTIDPKLMSHSIEKIWIDGKYIMGNVKTLHTKWGQDMTNFIVLDKGTIGFSLRAIGNTENKNGVDYISPQGFAFITYDAVINPSNPVAKFNPNVNTNIGYNQLLESSDYIKLDNRGNKVCINGICAIEESSRSTNPFVQVTSVKSMLLEQLDRFKKGWVI